MLHPKIQKAIYVATHQHRDQRRKVSEIPYIVHPFSVAWILWDQIKDEDIIASALLHDVLEDTEGYSYDDMVRDFGTRVADIVIEVTEDKTLPWRERKEKYISMFENSSQESLMLATADKINNLTSLYEDYLLYGSDIFKEFKSFEETKWFHESVYEVMERRLENKILLQEFKKILDLVFGRTN